VAQTRKKRRRKHRGTQGGRIDTAPRRRPSNRAEARQQAKARRAGGGKKRRAQGPTDARGRPLVEPTWGSAIRKALVAGVIFFILLAFIFSRPMGASAALAGFMLLFYIPMAYYTDRFFFNRRLAQLQRERSEDR
jgi:preprotein translocase subunit SecF